jgi:hypothetical protein
MSSEDSTLVQYDKSRQTFANASGRFKAILDNIPIDVKGSDIKVYQGGEIDHLLNPSYIVEPSVAKISGANFLSSTEQVRVGASAAINYIDSLQNNENTTQFTQDLSVIKKEFESARDNAIQSQQQELPKIVAQQNAPNDLQTYYRSIIDIQFSSKNLSTLATEITKEPISENSNDNNILSKLVNKVKALWDKIKTKIQQVMGRLRGIAESLENSIIDLLDKIEDVLKKGSDAIINAFISLSDYFVEFMVTLTEQMFKFLTKFGSIAAAEDYKISNIEIKIPSLKFEYVSMFSVSIPLPNIDPPEMTLSINRINDKSNQT